MGGIWSHSHTPTLPNKELDETTISPKTGAQFLTERVQKKGEA